MTFCQNVYSDFRELCIYVGVYDMMKNTRRKSGHYYCNTSEV